MKSYKITWTIELDARSPREAAWNALDSVKNGTARVFEVQETDCFYEKPIGGPELIDLENEED